MTSEHAESDPMTDTRAGALVRERRQALRMSQDGLVARLGYRLDGNYRMTGFTVQTLDQFETEGTVHVGGYVACRLLAALDVPLALPTDLTRELMPAVACALRHGYVSVRAACGILRTTEEDLQDALRLNGTGYVLYT